MENRPAESVRPDSATSISPSNVPPLSPLVPIDLRQSGKWKSNANFPTGFRIWILPYKNACLNIKLPWLTKSGSICLPVFLVNGALIGAGLGAAGFVGGPLGFITTPLGAALGGFVGLITGLIIGDDIQENHSGGFNFSKVQSRREAHTRKSNANIDAYNQEVMKLENTIPRETLYKIIFPTNDEINHSQFMQVYNDAMAELDKEQYVGIQGVKEAKFFLEQARKHELHNYQLYLFQDLNRIAGRMDQEKKTISSYQENDPYSMAWLEAVEFSFDPLDLETACNEKLPNQQPPTKIKIKYWKQPKLFSSCKDKKTQPLKRCSGLKSF